MEERAQDALSQGELYNQRGNLQARGSVFAQARPAQAGHGQKPYLVIGDGAKFAGMGEETLRAHFLVQLNGVYEGHATEETFNFEGNMDILIRVSCDTFGPAMPNVEEAIELRSPPTIHPQPCRGGHGEWRQPARGSSRVGKQSGTRIPTKTSQARPSNPCANGRRRVFPQNKRSSRG
jgi:hypothetical protein